MIIIHTLSSYYSFIYFLKKNRWRKKISVDMWIKKYVKFQL